MPAQFGSVAIDFHDADWIQGSSAKGKQVLSAKLPEVLGGSVIEVRASGSGRGHFYYQIVETTGRAKDVGNSQRVCLVDGGWHTLESSSLFLVGQTGVLNFTFQIDGYDTAGDHVIYHLNLIAKVL